LVSAKWVEAERQSQSRLVLGVALGVLQLLSGCAVGPDYQRPRPSVANSFANAPTNVVSPDEAALATWWRGFNDTKLDSLVQRAIANNHDLRIATSNPKESPPLTRRATSCLA